MPTTPTANQAPDNCPHPAWEQVDTDTNRYLADKALGRWELCVRCGAARQVVDAPDKVLR